MIRWLLDWIGLAPTVDPARRRCLRARLRDAPADCPESDAVTDAQRTLVRHATRERVVAEDKADAATQRIAHAAQRRQRQSDLTASTARLDRATPPATTRHAHRCVEDDPFMILELARIAARRRESS